MAATHRTALVLCGDGDLVPLARSIHRRAFGADRPFIVCDPRRRQHKATVRSPQNYETGMPAFAAAAGGSLCVRNLRLPHDFPSVVAALRAQNSQVRLVILRPGRRGVRRVPRRPDHHPAAPHSPRRDRSDHHGVRRGCDHRARHAADRLPARRSRLGADALRVVLARHREGHAPARRDPRIEQSQRRRRPARDGTGLAVALDRTPQAADARRAVTVTVAVGESRGGPGVARRAPCPPSAQDARERTRDPAAVASFGTHAGVDPCNKRIDRNSDDNVLKVSTSAPDAR